MTDEPGIRDQSGSATSLGDLERAEESLERVLSADPTDIAALRDLAKLAELRDHPGQAEDLLSRALEADPTDTAIQRDLARLAERRGDLLQARRYLERAVDAGDIAALRELALVLEREGDLTQARHYLERAVDAGDTAALRDLGVLLERVDDLLEARRYLEQAVDAGDTAARRDLRRLLVRGGAFGEPRSDLEKAIAQDQLKTDLGAVYERLSSASVAALFFAEALSEVSGRGEIHTEHIVRGLDEEPGGPFRLLLELAGTDRDDLLAKLFSRSAGSPPFSRPPDGSDSIPGLSAHASEAISIADRFAESTGSGEIETVHLLRGLLSVPDCGVTQLLGDHGVNVSALDQLTQTDLVEGAVTPPNITTEPPFVMAGPRPQMLAGAAADTVPEPGQGRVRRADRLGTAAEVEMLVSVLLAKDTPLPLAVGLFGDWGSGKSFFMALMEERMNELAALAANGRPEADPFCREIRTVRFNAWHYVDTDLWASLAATLFDELARAGDEDQAGAALKELDDARGRATEARHDREQLEREVADLTAKTQRAHTAIRPSLAVAIHAVRNDKDLTAHLKALQVGGAQADDPSAERLATALGDIGTAADKVHAAARLIQEEILHRRRSVTIVTFATFFILAIVLAVTLNWSVAGQIVALLGTASVGLTPALRATTRILYLARDAREARELPLLEKREQLAASEAAEQAAMIDVDRHEEVLAEILDKGVQLQKFVRERAASSDYRSRLGVISQVRRDLEQLVALLPGSKNTGAEQVGLVAAEIAERVPEVERIILFIDDLDRCPPDKVVDVLQAVHLLLAFKLFVVVVGVDSQWLQRSLIAHYAHLLEQPERYLEEIFQIPFALGPMSMLRFRDLIAELAPEPAAASPGGGQATNRFELEGWSNLESDVRVEVDADTQGDERREPRDEEYNVISGGSSDARTVPERVDLGVNSDAYAAARSRPTLPRPEALVISSAERDLLNALGSILETPRSTKRLVNIYRILRVSVSDEELDRFTAASGGEYEAVVLLLGILVGRPSSAYDVYQAVMAAPKDDEITAVLGRFPELEVLLGDILALIDVTDIEIYRRWAPRVYRFSFRLDGKLSDGAPHGHSRDHDAVG